MPFRKTFSTNIHSLALHSADNVAELPSPHIATAISFASPTLPTLVNISAIPHATSRIPQPQRHTRVSLGPVGVQISETEDASQLIKVSAWVYLN